MDCKKCGGFIPEDGMFCPHCGARTDGKKTCAHCGRLIDDDSVFCAYCGERTESGGKIVSEEICAIDVTAAEKTVPEKKNGVFNSVERVLSSALLLGGMLVLFICSFFIGARLLIEGTGTMSESGVFALGESLTALDFFSSVYKTIESVAGAGTPVAEANTAVGFYLPTVICTVAAIIGIAGTFAALLAAGIKYGVNLYRGKEIKGIGTCAAIAIACFAFSASVIFSYMRMSVSFKSTQGVRYAAGIICRMSSGSVWGFALFALFGIAAFVLKCIAKKGVVVSANLPSFILNGVALILFVVLLSVINCEALATGIEAFSNGGGTDGMVKGGFSSTLLLLTISAMIPSATATVHELNEVFASSIGLYLSYIVDAVVLCYLLFALIKGLLGDGNNKALKLVLAIVADVCSVAYLITAILLRDFGVNIGLETRGVAAPICAAVIAQLLLAVVIVGNALYKSEKK